MEVGCVAKCHKVYKQICHICEDISEKHEVRERLEGNKRGDDKFRKQAARK